MKVGDGSDVPRVTGRGAYQEGVLVVNEVGDNPFHELLWEIGDWRRVVGRRVRGTFTEGSDFSFGSVPKFVTEQFNRCKSVKHNGMVKLNREGRFVEVPDNEDVGVFTADIVRVTASCCASFSA